MQAANETAMPDDLKPAGKETGRDEESGGFAFPAASDYTRSGSSSSLRSSTILSRSWVTTSR